jgi:hypothetical protein
VSGWIEGWLYRAEGGEEEDAAEAARAKAEAQGEGESEAEVKVQAGDEVVRDEGEVVDEIVKRTEGLDV